MDPLRELSLWISGFFGFEAILHLSASLFRKNLLAIAPDLHWALFIITALFSYAFYSYAAHECWIHPSLRVQPEDIKFKK